MGLFKSIKKGLSKAWKGIKKGFKKVLGKIGKFFKSGWGKALMIVAGVVTMGTALAAGATAYSAAAGQASSSIFGNLVAGGSAVLNSLTGGMIGKAAPATSAAGGTVGAETVSQAAKVSGAADQAGQVAELAGAAGEVGATAAGGGGMLSKAAEGASNVLGNVKSATGGALQKVGSGIKDFASGAMNAVTGGPAELTNTLTGAPLQGPMQAVDPSMLGKAGGMLGKAAKGAGKFMTSEGGGQITGKVIEGYAQGKMVEEQAREERKQRRRLDKDWANFDWSGKFDVDLGPGWAQRANRTAMDLNRDSQMDYSSGMGADLASGYQRTGTGG